MNPLRERLASLSLVQRTQLGRLLHGAASPERSIPRRLGSGPARLSFAQERLWFISEFEDKGATYNVPSAVTIHGHIDYRALEQALNGVIARHEVLRTRYIARDGVPFQEITPKYRLELEVGDFRGGNVTEALADSAAHPFDLAIGPVIRASIFKTGEFRHILLLTLHHIACDGWSMGILNRELSASYRSFVSGTPLQLPELPIQYADFAEWQREELSGALLDRQLEYWKHRLDGAEALAMLEDRSAAPYRQAGLVPMVLPRDLCAALQRLSRDEGVTVFMVLLAAFQSLLSRYTGQTDISCGAPIANRDVVDIEDLIGFFVNTLVIRTDLSGRPSFRTLLARVRQSALDAYAHHDLPFEKLVGALQPQRSLTRTPFIQAMLAVQVAPASLQIPGAEVAGLPNPLATLKFDLLLALDDYGDQFRGYLTYDAGLFPPAAARRMAAHFERLLESAVAAPNRPVFELPILTEAERQTMLVNWNGPRRAGGHSFVFQEFEQAAAADPHRAAVGDRGTVVTYGDLNRRANRLAHALREWGVGPDRIVGVFLERSADMIAAVLAVAKAGGAYLPIDPTHPDGRLKFVLEDSGAGIVITSADLRHRITSPNVAAIDVEQCLAGREDNPRVEDLDPTHLAYLLYTSGSTGTPKGVLVTHRGLSNTVQMVRREIGFKREDVMPSLATLTFDMATFEIFMPLSCGGRVVIVPHDTAMDGEQLAGLLERDRITVAQATPTMWQMLIDSGWRSDPSFKVISAGEALGRNLADALLDRAGPVWNLYGPTETAMLSTGQQVRREPGPVPIGRPLPNTRVYVLDPFLQPSAMGVPGELYIGGSGVARGYLNRPELTAERFLDDPFSPGVGERLYRTGDMVRWREDGTLVFLGRLDDQVKIRGFRVEPAEIEATLLRFPGIRQAAVVVRERSAGDRGLCAYVAVEPGCAITARDLLGHLKSTLPDYMIPAAIRFLNDLPVGRTGKIDRKSLAASAAREPDESPGGEAPRTPLEILVAEIWSTLLAAPVTSVDANFFELGGHSLLAARVASRLRKALGITVPVRLMFEAPTVAELALSLAQLQAESLGEEELRKLLDEIEGGSSGGAAGRGAA
jgi:amino acid adenylation domain-containing protein